MAQSRLNSLSVAGSLGRGRMPRSGTAVNKLAEEISVLIAGLILSLQHPNAVLAEVKSLKWEVERLKIKVHTGDWVK
jgi:hypothetical protein